MKKTSGLGRTTQRFVGRLTSVQKISSVSFSSNYEQVVQLFSNEKLAGETKSTPCSLLLQNNNTEHIYRLFII